MLLSPSPSLVPDFQEGRGRDCPVLDLGNLQQVDRKGEVGAGEKSGKGDWVIHLGFAS